MRERRNYLWSMILLGLIIILGMELFLPRWAENMIRNKFEAKTTSIEELAIRVNSFPSFKILFGKLDLVEIKAKGIRVNDLYLDSLFTCYQDLLLKEKGFKGENIDLNILITEDSLNEYLISHYPSLSNFKVKINPEQVCLSGFINFFETKINIQLTGNFVINELNKISFIPVNFQIEEINISTDLIRNLIKEHRFSFDLNQLAIPLKIEGIEMNSKEIRIVGGRSLGKAWF